MNSRPYQARLRLLSRCPRQLHLRLSLTLVPLLYALAAHADHRPTPGQGFAAPDEQLVARDTGVWFGLYTTYWLSDKWGYYGEYHLRRSNFLDHMSKLYLRLGANYRPSSGLRLTLGVVNRYTWTDHPEDPTEEAYVPEFRFWEQALFIEKYFGLKFYHQLRVEQRWRRSTSMEDPTYYYYNRFRYKFLAYVPIFGDFLNRNSFFLCLYNEIFMQQGEKIQFNYYEDNRAYVGFGYGITDDIQLHFGYMKSFGQLDAFTFRDHDIFRLSLYHKHSFFEGDEL